MKVLKYKIARSITVLLLICTITKLQAINPHKNHEKVITKIYPILTNGSVTLDNIYGNMDIQTWSKGEVEILVNIQVDAKNEQEAEEVFDRIHIDIDNSTDHISIATQLEDDQSSWWSTLCGNDSKDKFEIHYTIKMPVSCSLDATNKYGNIDLQNIENDANITLKYGNFQGAVIEGNLNMELKYGNASLDVAHDLQLDLGYGKFSCRKVKGANIISKYSNISVNEMDDAILQTKYDTYKIGTAGNIKYDGKYDDIQVEHCKTINMDTKYTSLVIQNLATQLNVQCKYGSIHIWKTSDQFKSANIECRYTPVNISISHGYKIVAHTSKTDVKINTAIDYSQVTKEDPEYNFTGTSRNEKILSDIHVNMEYGSLKIHK